MPGNNHALGSATLSAASKDAKSPPHGFGAQVTSVVETGLAELVDMLDDSIRVRA